MNLTPKIRLALTIAARQHNGQLRKDNLTPYIIHPVEVAWLVSNYSNNEEVICSALLHDVLEDTIGYTAHNIKADFGSKVLDIVLSLTDTSLPDMSWEDRHKQYLANLQTSSDESVLVALADKYANVSSGPLKPERSWYYQGVINLAASRPLTQGIQLLIDFKKLLDSLRVK
jgi:(p)ppGpp synthase/HD superfamily hydrolase